jgi:hypothetical protein
MQVQYFKGDAQELKFDAAGAPILGRLNDGKVEFFDEAYSTFALGELLFDEGISPLSNAIPRNIFREAFESIIDAFVSAGTFESYLTVFRQIFGDEVEVTFGIPDPGKLTIDIVAPGVVLYDLITRYIEDNEYVIDEIVDDESENIALGAIKGFESQYEVEQMLFEMVPAGIYTEITLTIGEE